MSTEKMEFDLSEHMDLLISFARWWGEWCAIPSRSGRGIRACDEMMKYNMNPQKLKDLLEAWIREYLCEEQEIKDENDFFNFKMHVFFNLNYIRSISKKEKIEKEVQDEIQQHMKKHNVKMIIAWYRDRDDFYSDWCDSRSCGYSKEEADALLERYTNEFQTVDGCGILRYAV